VNVTFTTIGAEVISCNVGETDNYAVQNCTSFFQAVKNTVNNIGKKISQEIPGMKNIGENLAKIPVSDIQPSFSCYVSIINHYHSIIFHF
jgi:hypothetical protein